MPTRTAAKRAPAKKAAAASDAIKLLIQDHKDVKALFEDYDALIEAEAEDDQKQALATRICQLLTVHATVEEEIFYPAAREALEDDADLIDEADVEHASAKDLIAQIEAASPADDHYDAKVKVLGEYIDHHVQEEESEMFPKCRKAKVDTAALGADIAVRKAQLLEGLGLEAAAA